jgi:hypothetical protein
MELYEYPLNFVWILYELCMDPLLIRQICLRMNSVEIFQIWIMYESMKPKWIV